MLSLEITDFRRATMAANDNAKITLRFRTGNSFGVWLYPGGLIFFSFYKKKRLAEYQDNLQGKGICNPDWQISNDPRFEIFDSREFDLLSSESICFCPMLNLSELSSPFCWEQIKAWVIKTKISFTMSWQYQWFQWLLLCAASRDFILKSHSTLVFCSSC